MARHWTVKAIVVLVSFISAFLIGVYSEQIREIISTATGQTDTTIVFYVIWGTVIIIVSLGLIYLGWIIYAKYFKIDVLIQKDSLTFIKYPYLAGTHGKLQNYTNMSYGDITVHNNTKNRVNDCSLEIDLRKNNMSVYKSKVLSSDSTPPNPISVAIDGEGDKGFCPVGLHLESLQAFLPHDSLGEAGNFTGTLIAHGEYEILGRVLLEGKCGKWQSVGNIKIPSDLVEKAKIPNDIRVIIDQGGFAVYAELHQGKVRTKFYGNLSDNEIRRCFREIRRSLGDPKAIDEMIDVNGTTRKRPDNPPPAFLF